MVVSIGKYNYADGDEKVAVHQVCEIWGLECALDCHTAFAKYFITHSILNYARMIPVYLSDMK